MLNVRLSFNPVCIGVIVLVSKSISSDDRYVQDAQYYWIKTPVWLRKMVFVWVSIIEQLAVAGKRCSSVVHLQKRV